MQPNLTNICKQVNTLAKATGRFLQQQQGKVKASQVLTKSINSLVTYVDKEAEKRLVKKLTKILPGSGFITEEETIANKKEKYTWVIDPLDGTTNFIHGVPCYCISIGLLYTEGTQQEIILGVIYEPNLDELFYAVKGKGAFMNGKRIHVSKTKKLSHSLLVTGFPTYDLKKIKQYLNLFNHFMQTTRGLRRMGSAAVDLAYTACGRFDSFYEYSLNAWDVAAGSLIVKEAGGKVNDFKGGSDYLFGKEIIASNPFIHATILQSVKKYFR